MLRFILLAAALIFTTRTFGQNLSVVAGPDTTICYPNPFPGWVSLGSNMKVSGGTPPYEYLWELEERDRLVIADSLTYDYPSQAQPYWFLPSSAIGFEDEHASDPGLNLSMGGNVYPALGVKLTVTDSLGSVASDSFGMTIGGLYMEALAGRFVPGSPVLGDTVTFECAYDMTGYLPLQSYEWFPKLDEMITSPYEPDVDIVMAKIYDYSMVYQINTDIIGCTYRNRPYDVMYPPLGIETYDEDEVFISSNPCKGGIRISDSDNELDQVEVYDLSGKLVFKSDANLIENGFIPVMNPGVHILVVSKKDGSLIREPVVVQ